MKPIKYDAYVKTKMATFSHRSLADLRAQWRRVILDDGDSIGVDLRKMSAEILNEVILRFYIRAAGIRQEQTLGAWITDQLLVDGDGCDMLEDEMTAVVREMFGGMEKAS